AGLPPVPPQVSSGRSKTRSSEGQGRQDFELSLTRTAVFSVLQNAMKYLPSDSRYQAMRYNRAGRSGLKLPAISLGLWHNFGFDKSAESKSAICRRAFDLGITHFDLANNYGPPPGSAEID